MKKRDSFTHTTDSQVSSEAEVGSALHSLSGALEMFDQHRTFPFDDTASAPGSDEDVGKKRQAGKEDGERR